ncbi:glycoside hydrolase superfamily [Armillaria fumosa]|nr:glycoside hydrolase superfamily [Armillaria fumosa]
MLLPLSILIIFPCILALQPLGRSPSGNNTVIIQMFEWSWDSIASECTNFIGSAGYSFVQVSPPAEHIIGSQWWTDYQPVSYTLTSKRGNRTHMITTCHAAGVKVIVDTILNHMAGMDSGNGVAGDSYTHYVYPNIYQIQDFHHCGLTSNDDIQDYTSRAQAQTCELVNLADLATETEYVRGRLAAYVNDLLSLGVDGLRLDAAKHIDTNDIANIKSRFTSSPYITQEVIWGAGEPIQPSEYVPNGDVQEFRYTTALKNAFTGGSISRLQNLDRWVSGSQANVFVANHDTERNGNSLNFNSANNAYVLATIFSLAYPYGTPTILSSYQFSSTDDGAPNNGALDFLFLREFLTNPWKVAFTGMVRFQNNVGPAALTNWMSPQSSQIAFGRGHVYPQSVTALIICHLGSSGFVAINNAASNRTTSFTTSLADGSYCDVIGGKSSSGTCTGSGYGPSPKRSFVWIFLRFIVSGGSISRTSTLLRIAEFPALTDLSLLHLEGCLNEDYQHQCEMVEIFREMTDKLPLRQLTSLYMNTVSFPREDFHSTIAWDAVRNGTVTQAQYPVIMRFISELTALQTLRLVLPDPLFLQSMGYSPPSSMLFLPSLKKLRFETPIPKDCLHIYNYWRRRIAALNFLLGGTFTGPGLERLELVFPHTQDNAGLTRWKNNPQPYAMSMDVEFQRECIPFLIGDELYMYDSDEDDETMEED